MTIVTLQNTKKAIKNPTLVLDFIKRAHELYNIESRFISQVLSGQEEFCTYETEITESGLILHINERLEYFNKTVKGKTYRGNEYMAGIGSIEEQKRLYCCIRKFKPEVLVETGVCNGLSTMFILLAIKNNKKGKLYSIDFPEIAHTAYTEGTFWNGKGGSVIPKGEQPGWIIPEELKSNWELIIGKTQERLPLLLARLRSIDFFLHDSEHSYECMWFEYNKAYPILKKGGIFMSDDISWNTAFSDFAKEYQKEIVKIGAATAFFIK